MIRISNKIYSFLSLLFVFLSLLGYQLSTSIFLPVSSDMESLSQTVTYPYRAVVFIIAVLLIIFSPAKKETKGNGNYKVIYIAFMLIYLTRILIDIYVRDVFVQSGFKITVLQYMYLSVLPSIWATARCATYIDFEKLNRWLLIGGIIFLGITIWNQNNILSSEYDEMVRRDGNVALGTLGFGYSCVSLFIIFISWSMSNKIGVKIWRVLLVVFMIVSFVMMLRAGSRGPLVAFVSILLFLMYSKMKNKALALIISLLAMAALWIYMSTILEWLGSISPLIEKRMSESIYENDSSGRDSLYAQAIDIFMQNPILGTQFVLDDGFYSHNSILDVMIGLGFVGMLIWLYLIWKVFRLSYHNIHSGNLLVLISLLSIRYIVKSFFSGAMYIDNEMAICMIILFSINGKSVPSMKAIQNN